MRESSVMTGAGYLININDIAGPYSGIVFGVIWLNFITNGEK